MALYSGNRNPSLPSKVKGTEIMQGLLLSQYDSSPNLIEYYTCFTAELDFLFEQIEAVHQGRFLESAIGAQLDVIGEVLQQPRAVRIPQLWFGFEGATGARGMVDETNPQFGAPFKSEYVESFTVVPLEDETYRRLLLAKAASTNAPVASINFAYYIISIILGRVPKILKLEEVGIKQMQLTVGNTEISASETTLLLYARKYFVPAGVTFTINPI